MFYIGTKRGFIRSITSSGLLNETVDAARSAILMSEYYMVLDAQ